MLRYDILIYASIIILTLLAFLVIGYWLGRKTIIDTPLIKTRFNPKDNDKEVEESEIMRCLHGDE